MRNDKFNVHFTFGNSRGRQDVLDRHAEKLQERARNLNFAIFYLAVGVVLLLANQFAKQPQGDGNQRNAVLNVGLDLSIGRKPEPTGAGIGNNLTEAATYTIRFRLTNRGNQSVFYPVFPGTNRPIGRLFYRAAPGSEWVVLSWPQEITSTSGPPSVGGMVAWVEMRPGGWVDGFYDDPGSPGVDHAYELDLKVETNDKVVRLISQPYRVSAN
jgi:hypothetical protein